MIVLKAITKVFGRGRSRHCVLNGISAVFEAKRNYVILGLQGMGKSTLLRLLSGIQRPTRGSIVRYGKVGMPVGFAGLHGGVGSGRQLAIFLAELYGAEAREVVKFAAAFARLDDDMDLPISALRPAARNRLFYALGYAIPVDFYLFDDSAGNGDENFRKQCLRAFELRRQEAGTIFATRDARRARHLGEAGCLLHGGKLYMFDTTDEAAEAFERLSLEAKFGTLAYAEGLAKSGSTSSAQIYLRKYLASNRNDVTAHELLAKIALDAGDSAEAARACQSALAQAPGAAGIHFILATIAERESRLQDALMHLQDVLRLSPEHRGARILSARVHEALGLNSAAAGIWRSLAEAQPNSLVLWRLAIRAYAKAGDWEKVLESTGKATAETGREAASLELQIRALAEIGRFKDAEAAIMTLATRNLSRALMVVHQLTRTISVPLVAKLLAALRPFDLSGELSSPHLRSLLLLLEREAGRAQEPRDPDEHKSLLELIESINSKVLAKKALAPEPR